ncbi:hypothetical protein B7494_g2547 [Chlorociboria aeruginascens]|nr:hypothetical protein B7494_g2547 [Chlorociboria aeruginascens]
MSRDPRAFLAQADQAAASANGGFSFFGGRAEKWENAVELYKQAANVFKMQKQCIREAGQAFEKAAVIQTKQLKEPDDAANTYLDAFNVYKEAEPAYAVRCCEIAIDNYLMKGNSRRAATNEEHLAKVYEIGLGDIEKAAACYEQAADWYWADNGQALATRGYIKTAELLSTLAWKLKEPTRSQHLQKAAELYERIARASVGNNTMRYSLPDYLWKASLCRLALDPIAYNAAITGEDLRVTNLEQMRPRLAYSNMEPRFALKEDGNNQVVAVGELAVMMERLGTTVQAGDIEAFEDAVYELERTNRKDPWQDKMLKGIKDGIEEKMDDFS